MRELEYLVTLSLKLALAFLYERDVQRVPDVFSAALEAIGVCLLDVELEG